MNKYALIGKKLSHSYSAIIHNYIFKKLGIDASYNLIETDNLDEFIKYAKANLSGFNITIPYKEEILKYVDILDDKAKILKNVNTIKIVDNKLYGYNTDYDGFLGMLDYYDINYLNKSCYILGSGGAAKTCLNALSNKAKEVYMVSRSNRKDDIIGYDDLFNKDIDILVNATPVGMYPNILDIPVSKDIILKSKDMVDLIYNPKQTEFLKVKNSNNNGLIMLILQALKADEIWLDIKVDNLVEEVGELFE